MCHLWCRGYSDIRRLGISLGRKDRGLRKRLCSDPRGVGRRRILYFVDSWMRTVREVMFSMGCSVDGGASDGCGGL